MKKIYFIPLIFLFILSCLPGEKFFRAKAGVLDIRNWNFNTNSIIQLQGEWEFYWNEFCYSKNSTDGMHCEPGKKTSYIHMPGLWTKLSHIKTKPPISGNGFATHRLYIQTNTKEKLSIRLQNVYTAFKLWANGVLIAEIGKVSTDKIHSKPRLYPVIAELPTAENGIELILQISNYHHEKGGAWRKIFLGRTKDIQLAKEKDTARDLFISGCLFFVGFYHIVYFYYRKKDRSTFYFGAFSLLISLRILVVEEPFLYRVFPGFPYQLGMQIEFLTAFLAAPLFVFFISEFLFFTGLEKNNMIDLSITIPQFLFSIFILLTSPSIFTKTLPFLYLFAFISVLYILYKLSVAIKHRTIGSFFILISFLLLTGFAINDILYTITIINTGYFLSYGFLFFILAHRLAMVKEFAVVRNRIEELNKNLEVEVKLRTKQYRKEKKKAEEANLLKDKFMLLITHDLKSPIISVRKNIEFVLSSSNLSSDEKNRILKDNNTVLNELSSRIERLFELNRIKTTGIHLKYQHIDLRQMVEEVFLLLDSSVRSKSIKLINLIPQDTILTVDKALFSEVIFNLCHNSVKFCYPGCEIKIYYSQTNGQCLNIEDNGFGLSQEKIENIWTKSFSIQTPGTMGETGSGIGLLLCQEIIRLHRGELSVESKPHQKTCFQVTIPLNEIIIFILTEKETFDNWVENKNLSTMYIHCIDYQQLLDISRFVLPDLILTDKDVSIPTDILEENKDLISIKIQSLYGFDSNV